ncbi:MAG: Dabb family protein [Bacteroidetes bacterium]|nr:Dabb family protein [Bacteroidota bacterium]
MQASNRRKFIATAATLAATSTLSRTQAAANTSAKRPPLVHHVFFWLKNPTSTADRDKLVEGVKTLSKIPTVKELHVGVLANTEKRDVVDTSWAVSELMFFDDVQGQATYQSHPIHLEFIKNYSHLWEKVVVYDAMEA